MSGPSPWALERAEAYLASRDGRPLGDRAGIAAALDAARRDGAERMQEAAKWSCSAVDDRWREQRGEGCDGAQAASDCLDAVADLDPARVLAGEDGHE